MELTEQQKSAIGRQATLDEHLRQVFMEHFDVPSFEAIKEDPTKAGYRGWAMAGIEVAVAVANIVLSLKKTEPGRHFRALQDLTFGLNANDFWVKNAPVLMPLVTVMLNAHKDAVALKSEASGLREYAGFDKLISGSEVIALEIFSMILYIIGGPLLMTTRSVPLKLALLPLLF